MNAPRARWLLLTVSLLAAAAQAAVDVHLAIDVHADGAPGTQNLPPDKHYDIDATLGDTWMVVHNGLHTSVFDFDRRRRTVIDEAAHTRGDFSLYDVVGFRVIELANRRMLAKAMAAAKVASAPFDAVDTEHILSLQDGPANPLHVATDGDELVFSNGAKPLMRESVRSTPVPAAQARMFAQFMRYTWGGHPQILAALAQSNAIPATLVQTTYGVFTSTVAVKVASVKPAAGGRVDVTAIPLQPAAPTQAPIEQIAARGAAFKGDDIAAARQRNLALIADGFQAGRPFDAFLGILEWMLATGERPPALDAAQAAALGADPSVAALRAALEPHAKEQTPHDIAQLDALRPQTASQGYMIDLFVANDRAKLGDRQAGRDGLAKVLLAHPYLAGAYKDLGDALLASFDASSAWRCWDIGRHVAPGLASFQAVDQFENSLAAQHPEYF